MVVDKASREIISVIQSNGRKHNFRLFKESKTYIHESIRLQVDTGYKGLDKRHANTEIPKKRSKINPLTKENKRISSSRVLMENVIRSLKIFRILSEKYTIINYGRGLI